MFRVAVADVELVVGVVMDEDCAATEVECETVDFTRFFEVSLKDVDLCCGCGCSTHNRLV